MRTLILGLTGALALAAAADVGAAPRPDPYEGCRTTFAAAPNDYDSAFCFHQVTLDHGLWRDGERVFEELIREHPGNFWLTLCYGHLYRTRDPQHAERLYRQAAEAFRASGKADGELLARSVLRDFLFPLGRVDESTREIARVTEIGSAARDPMLQARAWNLQASHLLDTGGDMGHAFRLLKQAEAALFPDGPYRSKRVNLNALGQVARRMGRLDEALAAFNRLDVLATEQGDAPLQAIARYNAFNTMAFQEGLLPTPGSRERLTPLAERVLQTATTARHAAVQAKSHAALAELLARAPGGRPAALAHAATCLDVAAAARLRSDEAVCAWIEAALLASSDPTRAASYEARAIEATKLANSPRTQAYSAGRHMRHSWMTKSRDIAVRDSLAAIDTVETLRGLQDDATSSADLFSAWTLDYYWLSGRLLQEGGDDNLSLAFSVTERMRARALLEILERSRQTLDPRHPAVVERRRLLEAIAGVQRTLMDPALPGEQRASRLRALEELERGEREAERQIALSFPERRGAQARFADLEDVQAALSEHEALLSFQVGLWDTYEGDFGGGSWLLAVTKHRTTRHRLPDRTTLSDAVPVFNGLLDRPGRESPAAVRLYADLVGEALGSLPPGATRLVIAADGPLHQLPFESLRATAHATPLGQRYEVAYTPSATLWLQWRGAQRPSSPGRTVTFADPELDTGTIAENDTRGATLLQGLRLGRLPYAREESRTIATHVGPTTAFEGASASERAVKALTPGAYDILHFAAHAVADEAHPERSAVLLAPGDAKEDGLLQAREIESLHLDGTIVVLSACQTAAGAVQSGEGVLSLARAFFAAGAQAVIGSRWPLRDEDAAMLFDSFYRHLGRGVSLAAALKAAQQDARDEGLAPSAWAGLVLLGNGDLRPFAGRGPIAAAPAYTMLSALALACLAVCGGLLLQRYAEHRRLG